MSFAGDDQDGGGDRSWLRRNVAAADVALTCLATFYVCFSVPFRIAFVPGFSLRAPAYAPWVACDYAVDAFFMLRWLVETSMLCFEPEDAVTVQAAWFSTGTGTLDTNSPTIRFLRGLLYHASATVPLELVAPRITSECSWAWSAACFNKALLQANRLLRVLQAPEAARRAFSLLEHRMEVGRLRMWLLFLIMSIAGHWAACAFFIAARLDEASPVRRAREDATWPRVDGLWNTTLVQDDVFIELERSRLHAYARSYYWALVTMVTTGYGDIVPRARVETWTCIICMYVGMSISCAAIANLTLLVMSANAQNAGHLARLDGLRRYARYRRLPPNVARRVVAYVEHEWSRRRGVDAQAFDRELPATLRQACARVRAAALLRKLPALAEGIANEAVVNALALKLEAKTYAPQDDVVRPGERVAGAILVSRGELAVRSRAEAEEGQVLRLKSGDAFGVRSLFAVHQSTVLVQAHSYCDAYWLLRRAFVAVCRAQCSPQEQLAMAKAADPPPGDVDHLGLAGGGGGTLVLTPSPHKKEKKMLRERKASRLFAWGGFLGARRVSPPKAAPEAPPPSTTLNKPHKHAWHRPGSRGRALYEAGCFALVAFYGVALPLILKTAYASSIFRSWGGKERLLLATYVVDVCCIIDLVLRSTVVSELEHGVLVDDGPGLRRLLRTKRYCLFEVLCLLPWDLLALVLTSGPCWPAVLRAAKLPLVMLRLPSQTRALGDVAGARWRVSKAAQKIMALNGAMLLACHWAGCAWLLAGRASVRVYGKDMSWITLDRASVEKGFVEGRHAFLRNYDTSAWNHATCTSSSTKAVCTYLRAVYFALVSISTVGYGDIRPAPENLVETIFCCFVILFGGLMVPAVVGGLASLMADLNKDAREYRARVAELRHAMDRHDVRAKLRRALLQYHNYVWARRRGADEREVLKALPAPLRRRALHRTIGSSFLRTPFFSTEAGVEDVARQELVSRLEPRVFLPGDLVLAEGDLGRPSLFLVERGVVDLYAAKAGLAKLASHLRGGDDDEQLPSPQRKASTASLISVASSETQPPPRKASMVSVQSWDSSATMESLPRQGSITKLSHLFKGSSFRARQKQRRAPPQQAPAPIAAVPLSIVSPVARRGAGDFFGAECLLESGGPWCADAKSAATTTDDDDDAGRAPRTSAVARAYADCFELHRSRYLDVLKGFPSSAQAIRGALWRHCAADARRLDATLENLARAHVDENTAKRYGLPRRVATDADALRLATAPETLSTMALKRKVVERADDDVSLRTESPRAAPPPQRKITIKRLEGLLAKWFGDPEGEGQVAWSCLVVVAIVYQLFSSPYHLAFLPREAHVYALDWCFDVVFLADAFLRATAFGFVEDGKLVADGPEIWRRYRRHSLLFDVVTCAPLDLVLYGSGVGPLGVALARFPKALRVIRLGAAARVARPVVDVVEAHTLGNRLGTLLRLLGTVILIAHWAALLFFALARYKRVHGMDVSLEKRWRCTWVRAQIWEEHLRPKTGFGPRDRAAQYLRALNWALPTLVVIVIGDVVPATCAETLYVFLCIAAGMSVNAMIIGKVAAAIANSEAASTELAARADRLEKYMQQHRVPLHLRRRVNAFVDALQKAKGDSSAAIANTAPSDALAASPLPHTLRARVCVAVRLPVLKRCPIFESCPEAIKRALALHLTPETYAAGDLVVQYGDHGDAMHFLTRGTVEVVGEDGRTIYATLDAGSFFGEGALFSNVRRAASIRCACFSECLALSRADLQHRLRAFGFPQRRLLDEFTTIRRRNADVNAAISRNLKEAERAGSRLRRVLGDVSLRLPTKRQTSFVQRFRSFLGHRLARGTAGRALWDALSAVAVLYEALVVPYRAAFTLPDALSRVVPGAMGPDYACDAFFLLSLICRCAMKDDAEERQSRGNLTEVLDAHCVGARYRRSRWLWLDILAALPLELFYVVVATNVERNVVLACRLNRLLRVGRLSGFVDAVLRHLALRRGVRVSKAEKALAAVYLAYLYVNHWYACAWFAIHRYFGGEKTWATVDGIAALDDICRIDVADCYTRSVHLVITTISSVGYGDIWPQTPLETGWQIVVVVTGACLFASLIGAYTLILEAHDTEGASAFRAKLRRYDAHMHRSKLPKELRESVLRHHEHRYALTRCVDEASITSDLTAPLRMDLALYVHRTAFAKIRVFSALPRSTARRLAAVARTQKCGRGEVVYAAGDVGWDVYFVFAGAVRLSPPEDPSILDFRGRDARERFQRDDPARLADLLAVGRGRPLLASRDEVSEKNVKTAAQRRTAFRCDETFRHVPGRGFGRRVAGNAHRRSVVRSFVAPTGDQTEAYPVVAGVVDDGDHFGEFCLQSESGVRQETARCVLASELYTISRADLEAQVVSYESDDVIAVFNDLLQVHSLS